MFSILIPTWNNLDFLKLCVQAIQKNSAFPHQILIHVNDGSDGTLDWVKQQQLLFTHSPTNIGICTAVNNAAKLASTDYIVFMNDDMYVLPGWDKTIATEISKLDTDCFMLSSTMIEPRDTKNKCVIVADYGTNADNFELQKLEKEYTNLKKEDWSGSTWPPNIVHKKWWDIVGGYSEEFSPGMSSDDDFAMKMWHAGCRVYKGVSASRVYHFISKSTGRVVKNDGRKQFLQKWGIKQSTFHKYYIKRGEKYNGTLPEPAISPGFLFERLSGAIKKML
jgi:glycosyltransferase involved in cell wall biosynthesis